MNKTIKISKFASGSRKDTLGDGTLFYSSDVSDYTKSLGGFFMDNPPVLSKRWASLVWRYNCFKDQSCNVVNERYVLIHVQGSHVVNEAMGRYYPYRAGYEVTRDDMNKIGFSLTSLINAVPRISNMPSGRVEVDTSVTIKKPDPLTASSDALCQNIIAALVRGKRLLIDIPPNDSWREDGVLKCFEMGTLLAAIDNMDINMRRYATFAFCVDEHFGAALDGVLVVCYQRGSNFQRKPDDICMTWSEATSKSVLTNTEKGIAQAFPYPGENSPLMTVEELQDAYKVYTKKPNQLKDKEWTSWLLMGHQLTEIKPKGWVEFRKYRDTMPDRVKRLFVKAVRPDSAKWGVDGLTDKLFSDFNKAKPFTDEELESLRQNAIRGYVEKDDFPFLFPEGLSKEQIKKFNDKYLRGLHLEGLESIEKWYEFYEDHDRLTEPCKKTFAQLLKSEAAKLSDLNRIIRFMEKYPFVPVDAYQKPQNITSAPPSSSMKKLTDEQKDIIERWVEEAAKHSSINDLAEAVSLLEDISRGKQSSIKSGAIRQLDKGTLLGFIKKVSSTEHMFQLCERLLQASNKLPKDWKDLEVVISPAVEEFFFGAKRPWNKSFLMTPANWPKLAGKKGRYPELYKLIKLKIQETILGANDNEIEALAEKFKEYCMSPKGQKHEINIIDELYINTMANKNRKLANESQEALLKSSGKKILTQSHLLIGIVGALVLGCILGILGSKLFCHGPETPVAATASTTVELVGVNSGFLDSPDNQNLMVMLAQHDEANIVKVGSMTLNMDSALNGSSDALSSWNSKSLQPYSKLEKAKIVYSSHDGEVFPPDTISKERTLFSIIAKQTCHVDTVTVLGQNPPLTIVVPNKEIDARSFLPDKTRSNAKYYFELIKYIDSQLPKEKGKEINLPY